MDTTEDAPSKDTQETIATDTKEDGQTSNIKEASTEWYVVAEIEDAHDVFEVNHVCWARRADRNRKSAEEEIIISTGDDGAAKVWTLDGQE